MKPLNDSSISSTGARPRIATRAARASVCYFRPPEHEIPGGDGLSRMRDRAASLRAFREVSARYFREEAPLRSRADVLLFAVISAIVAWPIGLAISAAISLLGLRQ
jgi:hypothetical protein